MALQLTWNIQDGVPWVKRSSLDEREVLSTGACTIIMAKGQNVIQESLKLLPVLITFIVPFLWAKCLSMLLVWEVLQEWVNAHDSWCFRKEVKYL